VSTTDASSDETTGNRPLRILVGVDGSPESLTALRTAATMQRGLGGRLRVVTAWAYPAVPADGFVPPPVDFGETAAGVQRAALVEVLGEDGAGGVDTAVTYGGAAQVLIEESRDADLLVLGSRGLGGFAGLLLGSVSRSVAEHAHCDVLVARGTSGSRRP
jgi:nucleotide-binding universal stress UspA family protein